MSVAKELNTLLGKITGKTVSISRKNDIECVIKAYSDAYKCAVTFNVTPSTAVVVLKDSNNNAVAVGQDGKYHVDAGTYTYSITADGYNPITNQTLTISSSDVTTGTKTVTVEMVVASAGA